MAFKYGIMPALVEGVDEHGLPIYDDRAVDEEYFARYHAELLYNGVSAKDSSAFQVIANGDNTVTVKPGAIFVNGYFAYDEEEYGPIEIATPPIISLVRKDRIVMRLNKPERKISIEVIEGESRIGMGYAPPLVRNNDIWDLGLAIVTAEAKTSNSGIVLTQSAIEDTRYDKDTCGVVANYLGEIDTELFAQHKALFEQWFEDLKMNGEAIIKQGQDAMDTHCKQFEEWYKGITSNGDELVANYRAQFEQWYAEITGSGDALMEKYTETFETWFEGIVTQVVGQQGTGTGAEIFNDYINNQATASYAHAEGNKTAATALYAHAEGSSTKAAAMTAHAEGNQTEASGNNSHAEGFQTVASGICAHAEGQNASAVGQASHAEGWKTTAEEYAHAEGKETSAEGYASHTEGEGTVASGSHSHAEGYNSDAAGIAAHAEGEAKAYADYSHAEGRASASGEYSHAEGSSLTEDDYAHAEGESSEAGARGAHAEGCSNAYGVYSHSEGDNTAADGRGAHAEGITTSASGIAAHAEGESTKASGDHSHAEGYHANATGRVSHAEGDLTFAREHAAHAEGEQTYADGECSHAEGLGSIASGGSSHAEGQNTQAIGHCSHAEGSGTIANGNCSHAEGKYNIADEDNKYAHIVGNGKDPDNRSNAYALDWDGNAYFSGKVYSDGVELGAGGSGGIGQAGTGVNSVILNDAETCTATASGATALGFSTKASGAYSLATGSSTTASRQSAVAEGSYTTASGLYSHAQNQRTVASGTGSTSAGLYTTASTPFSFVTGKYNVNDSEEKYAFIVGNGTSSSRSNAYALDWDGNAYFSGKVYSDGVELGAGRNMNQQNTIIIGCTSSGHTVSDCDYLCTGTNDQLAFNKAIEDAKVGDKVLVLKGTYKLAESIHINKAITLEGIAKSEVKLNKTIQYLNTPLINITASESIVKNFSLTGARVTSQFTGDLALGINASNCKISDLNINSFSVDCSGSGNRNWFTRITCTNGYDGFEYTGNRSIFIDNEFKSSDGMRISGTDNFIQNCFTN